jgi:3,4-dihydroxy 2-butanone 4-phosphate synthase/GTP cyclohydrolase II
MNNYMQVMQNAMNMLRAGGMVVLVDDEHRENEGDLVMAAELVTPDAINFMATHGRGLICLSLTQAQVEQLNLPMMTRCNGSPYDTAFTVSIEAAQGISTGISAKDRAHTIKTAIDADATPRDVIYPGHVFPLKARQKGVIERRGHTEGSIDLMRLSGLQHSAVICEIMNEDGTMSRMDELRLFAEKHHLPIISIQDILNYRIKTEELVTEEISARIPMDEYGDLQLRLFKNDFDHFEHFILYKEPQDKSVAPLVRIHSECLTGDLLGSLKCDCGPQLHSALQRISQEGGALIYLRQEGRGIGLVNKLRAYVLQDQGFDTVDANVHLGLPVDGRDYSIAYQMLKHLGWERIRLMTNNPSKIELLSFFGIEVVQREAIEAPVNVENEKYIKVKKQKLGHLFQTKK